MNTNKTLKAALLKSILSLSDNEVLECAMGIRDFALFPEARQKVQHDRYFACEVQDRAHDQYWDQFGPHEVLIGWCINDFFELPEQWRDFLQEVVEADNVLRHHWEIINDLLTLGLAEKANQLRNKLANNVSESDQDIDAALDKINYENDA